MPLLSALSFVSVPAGDESLYHAAVEFYTRLGFTRIQDYDHSAGGALGVRTISTHAADSLRETWLGAVPTTANPPESVDQVPDHEFVSCATVKVRYTRSGPTADQVAAKISAIKAQADRDWRGLETSFVFHTTHMRTVLDLVEKSAWLAQREPSEAAPIEAYVVDPLGNVLGFTTRANPFTTAVHRQSAPEPAPAKSSPSLPKSASDDSAAKKNIAVLTSGGDAPGMNAAVRAVIRTAIHRGANAYAVMEGYQGLVDGGDQIRRMDWDDVRGYLSVGGTSIGTARCKAFRERKGRLQAAHNMVKHGIDGLVVVGGDGSLTGADLFRSEWPSLVRELLDNGQISLADYEAHKHLYICGLVGSIDNDMCMTDTTIGAYSSLDRICGAVDAIDATALSHSRAFVVEVMGRHCGWLALMAGIATGADYIFIPEQPAQHGADWAAHMSKIVMRRRSNGMRKSIVIVAEGAIDSDLNPVTPAMVKDVLVSLGLDTRVTTLGHVQRGGTAVSVDRAIATVQGVEAVDALLSLTPDTPSPMIAIKENKVVRVPLMEAVKLTQSVAEAIKDKDFSKAMSLRDADFVEHLRNFYAINKAEADRSTNKDEVTDKDGSTDKDEAREKDKARDRGGDAKDRDPSDPLKIAIMCVGAPAGGMNAAIRAATCYCLSRGHTPYAIHNGFTGLARHESVRKLEWLEVERWANEGGCEIGTNRNLPEVDLGMIAYYFQKYGFDGLIIIGGFEAYHSLHQLERARTNYPAFRIPLICLPATISNNVPGTEYSLGTDTCLNALVQYCDVVKQSASSTRRRVFVVEVQGGRSGYIAAYAGLVTGAFAVYTPEEGISLKQLSADVGHLKDLFLADSGRTRAGRLVLRNERSSETFSTEMLVNIFQNEADGKFEAREAIPGHVQQGGIPSPLDRVRATRLAIRCVQFLEDSQALREAPLNEQYRMASVVGVQSSRLVFTPIRTLWEYETEVDTRRPKKIHWARVLETADMLVGRPKV